MTEPVQQTVPKDAMSRVLNHGEILQDGDIIYNTDYGQLTVDGLAGGRVNDLPSFNIGCFIQAERKISTEDMFAMELSPSGLYRVRLGDDFPTVTRGNALELSIIKWEFIAGFLGRKFKEDPYVKVLGGSSSTCALCMNHRAGCGGCPVVEFSDSNGGCRNTPWFGLHEFKGKEQYLKAREEVEFLKSLRRD